ncbi:MAG: hypothetical protein ACP5OC_04945, partial [Thermoplasmata archaeon]
KLDMRISVSVEQKHPLISVISRDYQYIPLHIDTFGGRSSIDLFLESGGSRQMENIAANYKVLRMDDVIIVRLDVEEIQGIPAVVRDVLSLDSVCPSGFFLERGLIKADFRFHHSDLPKVSEIIAKTLSQENNVKLTDLGKGKGAIATLKQMNDRVRLSVVSYEVGWNPGPDAGIPDNFIFDAKPLSFEGKEIEAIVLYGNSSKERKFGRPVSIEDGVYTTKIDSDFVKDVWTGCNEKHIPRGAVIAKPSKGQIQIHTFLPSSLVNQYIEVLFKATKDRGRNDVVLTGSRAYDNSIWELI